MAKPCCNSVLITVYKHTQLTALIVRRPYISDCDISIIRLQKPVGIHNVLNVPTCVCIPPEFIYYQIQNIQINVIM